MKTKLTRKERIEYLKTAINLISNLRYAELETDLDRDPKKIVFNAGMQKPNYSWWTIFIDIVIALQTRI